MARPSRTGSCPPRSGACGPGSPPTTTATGKFVKVLAAALEDGLEAVEAACAEALECGACSAIVRPARVPRDVVLNILTRQRQPAPPAAIPTPEGLQLRHQPVADCQRYDSLREAGHGAS